MEKIKQNDTDQHTILPRCSRGESWCGPIGRYLRFDDTSVASACTRESRRGWVMKPFFHKEVDNMATMFTF